MRPVRPRTDLLAPRFLLTVEGTRLREDVTAFVREVEYEEQRDHAGSIRLEVLNQNFRFLDDRVFAEGNWLDLWVGYAGKPLHFLNRGVIVAPDPRFPRAGIPTLSVVAHDVSQNLMTVGAKDRGRTYSGTDSDIVRQVYGEEGIAALTFDTRTQVTRTRKRGQPRWAFLRRLAQLHGFVIWVRYDPAERTWMGYFGPPDAADQPSKHRFVYGTGEADATLLEFHPRSSLTSQSTEVEVSYTDPKTRKHHRIRIEVRKKDAERTRFTAATGRGKLRCEIGNGPSVTLTCLGQREEVVADRQFSSPSEARRWAVAWFAERQDEFVTGEGTLVGSPDVRIGQVHELVGLGPRLSGDWVLTRVTHRLSGSSLYETEFTASKKALRSVVADPSQVSAARSEEVLQ